jgi:hypothetical protein
MNNLQSVRNIFISNGAALPVNNAAITAVTSGQTAVFGSDMTALNPASGDTITTQPFIYLIEGKTGVADGVDYVKRSFKIGGTNVTGYKAESYAPAQREVWAIGYNRKTSTGLIEVNNDSNYHFTIRFKNDKFLYSQRPEVLNVNFQSSATTNTQFSLATTIAASINNSSFKVELVAVVVGNGTGVYGLTAATAWGVEITSKDVNQFASSTYTPNKVYFSCHVDDSSGFGTTTTCTQIQAFSYGSGTYDQVSTLEAKFAAYEGVTNRRLWPVPSIDPSASSTLILSAAIGVNVSATISEDVVTFAGAVNAILRAGEKVEINSVNYEIKYFISTTVAVLTTTVAGTFGAANVCKVRLKYDTINIDVVDSIVTPTGVVASANKQVIIAVPAINTAGAYNSLSTAGTDLKALLDGWMATTPLAPANISI